MPSGPVNNLVFELQIKTFLQHAWTIATHDLIYKTDEINWNKSRVAYQIKAMLENAEVSILKAVKSKRIHGLPVENYRFQELKRMKTFITKNWGASQLPVDVFRLTNTLHALLPAIKVNIQELQEILDKEATFGRGTLSTNLSPYLTVMQSLIYQKPIAIKSFIQRNNSKVRLVFTYEMEFAPLKLTVEEIKKSKVVVFI